MESTVWLDSDSVAAFALAAATEIDRIQRGRPARLDALKEFADSLEHFSPISAQSEQFEVYLAPSKTDILSRAVSAAMEQKVSDMRALSRELKKLTDEMRSISEVTRASDALVMLKRFCLTLNEYITRARGEARPSERGVFDYDHSFVG